MKSLRFALFALVPLMALVTLHLCSYLTPPRLYWYLTGWGATYETWRAETWDTL